MVSKAKIKMVRSLGRKKYRDQLGLFLVEGEKMVGELLSETPAAGYRLKEIIALRSWIEKQDIRGKIPASGITEADEDSLSRLSQQVSPQPVMALVEMPARPTGPEQMTGDLILGLESVRDPGNLGSIIRTADWFGIRHIICSEDSVDLYNPKVVQATMGALFRVNILYAVLPEIIRHPAFGSRTIFGTFLSGENIYRSNLAGDAMILFGNEARGLSAGLASMTGRKITIPSYDSGERTGPESLNLAASVAVVCSEFRRQAQK